MTGSMRPLWVVGIGADGWPGLPPASRAAIGAAEVLVGGRRQLGLVPEIPGQDRRAWPSPLLPALPGLLDGWAGRSVAVLASGDPLLSGIGSTLIDLLGVDRVRVLPAVSSVTLAAARLGWAFGSYEVVTVVGRNPAAVLRVASPGRRVIVLSTDGATPSIIAGLLAGAGYGRSLLTVLSDLASQQESRLDATAVGFPADPVPALNLVAVTCLPDPGAALLPTVPGLPDDAFEHDGQLTKRDLRASALARLAPTPGQLLWDVGAGAGSVAIEWLRTDPRCRAIAIERDPERAARIGRNAGRLGVPDLTVITGAAPEALSDLPRPDAVFVGGGATVPGVLQTCWQALPVGGRLVVHGVTLETEELLLARHREWGGELVRLSVDRVEPIGSFRGWAPARPVIQWSIVRTTTQESR
jgi:precorrin-6Y C5,15-methyltransferase (decarboxylating)